MKTIKINFNWQQIAVSLCLILLLISVIVWFSFKNEKSTTVSHQRNSQNPDFFGKDVSVWTYNQEGSLTSKVFSESIKYFAHEDKAWLTYPSFANCDLRNKKEMHAKSDKGVLMSNSKVLRLLNHVVVTYSSEQSSAETLLKTDEMTIDTKANLAETNCMVDISQGCNKLISKGLEYNYKSDVIKLKSRVHGVSEALPKNKKMERLL